MKQAKSKKERNRKSCITGTVLIPLSVIIFLLYAGLILYFMKREPIVFDNLPEVNTVVPGSPVSLANIGFTVTLPKTSGRPYALKIHDVVFDGNGLTFADMNEGEWEYSIDGNKWQPLILSQGERVLETEATAGRKILSLRASDNLDAGATGGKLSFKLKLSRQ